MLAIYGGKSVSYAPLCVRADCRLSRCPPRMKRGDSAAASGTLRAMPLLEIASGGFLGGGDSRFIMKLW